VTVVSSDECEPRTTGENRAFRQLVQNLLEGTVFSNMDLCTKPVIFLGFGYWWRHRM